MHETLIKTLFKEGEIKSQVLLDKARQEAEAIVRQSELDAARLRDLSGKETRERIVFSRAKTLSQARRESGKMVLSARHRFAEEVFREAERKWIGILAGMENSPAEELFWKKRVEESLDEFSGEKTVARIDRKGPLRLEEIFRKMNIPVEQVPNSSLYPGFQLESENGRKKVTFSYPAIMEKFREDLLQGLSVFSPPDGRVDFPPEEKSADRVG